MNEKQYKHGIERLRSPDRVALLEIDKVVALCCEGITVSSMLDVGTGSGLFAEAFAAKALVIFGVDVNPEMLAAAKELVPVGHFRQAPAEALPMDDDLVDLVFLGHMLHEVDDPLLAMKEATRVAQKRVAVLEWPYVDEAFGPPLHHRLKADEVSDLARQVGLKEFFQPALSHMALYLLEV